MSVKYDDIQGLHEDGTPRDGAATHSWIPQGLLVKKRIPHSLSRLNCSPLTLLLGFLFTIFFLTIIITQAKVTADVTEVKASMNRIVSDEVSGSLSSDVRSIQASVRNLEKVQTATSSLSSEVQSIQASVRNVEKVQTATNSLSSDVQSIQASVRNLENVQTATTSLASDIQRILGFLGKVTEELQKMNNSSDPLCSEGWSHYGLSCYYLSSDKKSWNDAKKDCKNKEANLVVINGEEERNFLRGIANTQLFWIGLTDADGTWSFVDGTSYDMAPKFWKKFQPDNYKGHGLGGGEDCAALESGYEWNDRHCSEGIKYICEKKVTF